MNQAILILPFLLGLAPGVYLAKERKWLALGAFMVAVAGVAGWALAGIQDGPGAGPMLSLFIVRMLSPVVIGLAAGGLIGLYLGRRAGHIGADDQDRSAEPV